MKSWFQSKTVWLGVLAIIAGIAEFMLEVDPGASAGTIIIGILGIIVRYFTNTSIRNGKDDA